MTDQCNNIIKIVEKECLPAAKSPETKAFFYKMIGDYYRYMSESYTEAQMDSIKQHALGNYAKSQEQCASLNACNPIRLGLALNFSVFQYEVMNNKKQAVEVGEQALTEALEKIDDVDEETFRDAKSIIELLKENLSLWKEEDENNLEDL